ncbi:hypothetical protein L2E82_32539 [Cichorium intybus]|uniref:Uncharacterized protein n=1 Tax=Cichorium intybus TaxID=13427 RepID=A0ACB9BHV5_CICIN|nr:hypothetical protein L2E82_32539 [Cichorium intybus]
MVAIVIGGLACIRLSHSPSKHPRRPTLHRFQVSDTAWRSASFIRRILGLDFVLAGVILLLSLHLHPLRLSTPPSPLCQVAGGARIECALPTTAASASHVIDESHRDSCPQVSHQLFGEISLRDVLFPRLCFLSNDYVPNILNSPTYNLHITDTMIQKKLGLDFDGIIDIKAAPEGSFVLLHGCAHNPTSIAPTPQQCEKIADVIHAEKHFPFFDVAYQV